MSPKPRTARAVQREIFDDGDDPRTRPRRGLRWLLFRAPGALILWWRYYFAKPGNVRISARQKGSWVMEVAFSLGFWMLLLAVYLMLTRR